MDQLAEKSSTVYQGWLLKKRRKKMQGFARRYFSLHQSGLLTYSFQPGQPVRDQLNIREAAISTSPGRKDIHIDSNTTTFHIKCLSSEDFSNWMTAFRQFKSIVLDLKKAPAYRQVPHLTNLNSGQSVALLEEMGNSVVELENSISNLFHEHHLPRPQPDTKLDKHSHVKDPKFGFFRKTPPQLIGQDISAELERNHGSVVSSDSLTQIRTQFDTLKSQYNSLMKIVNDPRNETNSTPSMSSIPFAVEKIFVEHRSASSPVPRKSLHDSITTISDSVVEWFDAVDEGPQEFVMDLGPETSQETSSIESDVAIVSPIEEKDGVLPLNSKILHRVGLPCLPPVDEGSLFAILKKNVGKDLSSITFPVTFNEPLTMLQRVAEEVEYYSLLDNAANTSDPVTRISYVAAFAVSGYAHTRHRTGRKAFNPMLGETFEDIHMKFLSEKVRHNPLEIAYHASGENWELTGTSRGRTKFWGKSLEIIPTGINRLKMGKETYVWKKPSSFIRNLMIGTKYFEHSGKLIIESDGDLCCVLDFKPNGYWGPTNIVSGDIQDRKGTTVGELEGKWDDQLCQKLDATRYNVLWKLTPFPNNSLEFYGFTSYAITLNELTTDIARYLPSTDSRYRPDVRALENGELDIAEKEKLRVERMQRERRSRGEERIARWFKKIGEEWHYVGGYWEARSALRNKEEEFRLW